jgi:hypothetical protein
VWLSPVEHCVRDAGVAGSNPATPTMIFLGFSSSFTISSQVNPGINPRYEVLARFRRDGGRRLAQEFWVVVAIGIEQHLDRHPKKPGRFPRIRAALHQPGRGRVPVTCGA